MRRIKRATNRLVLFLWWFAEGKKPQNKKRKSRVLDCVSCLDWWRYSSFFHRLKFTQRSL